MTYTVECADCSYSRTEEHGHRAAPKRWGDTGTARKWRYFPRWHLTRHPELPERVRSRHEVRA